MANLRERAPAPGSVSRSQNGGGDGSVSRLRQELGNPSYFGFDTDNVLQNSDDFVGELFQGAHFRSVNVPNRAPAGGTITISGRVHLDNPGRALSGQDIRVRVESPALNAPEIQTFQQVKHCQERPFNIEIPAPQSEGQVSVTVKGQQKTIAGWQTGERVGPKMVDVVPEDEYQAGQLAGLLPYAAVGGGAGFIYGRGSGQTARFALAGSAVGAGVGFGVNQSGFQLPNIPLWGIAAAGVGIAALVSTTGLGDVLQPAGERVGQAIEGGRRRVESVGRSSPLPPGRG